MKFKKLLNMFVVAALACSLVVTPVFAEPSEKDLKDQKAKVETQVNSLQQELTSLLTKINNLEMDLVEKGEQVIKTEADLKVAKEKEEQQYEDMKLRIKYMYEEGGSSAVEKIFQSGSIAEMLTQAEYAQKIQEYDRNMLDEYVETVDKVKKMKNSLEKDIEQLNSLHVQLEKQQGELSSTLESKKSEVKNLDVQIQEAAKKAAEERARKEREEAERKRREEAAQQQSNRPSNSSRPTPSPTPTPAPSPEPSPAPAPDPGPAPSTGNTAAAQTIVSAAWSQIGVPYVWGGNTPGVGLDCSGLTKFAHAQAGISIPRYSEDQLAGGRPVSNPQPGDIAWTPGHVAIYIGNGQMIEAQQPGTTICVSGVRSAAFVRYW